MLNGGFYNYVLDTDYTEYKETGKESYSPGANAVKRVLDFYDWENRFDFMSALMGFADGTTGFIEREPPDMLDENTLFVCTDAQVEGIGPPGQQSNGDADFPIARVTATYSSVNYNVPNAYGVYSNDYKSKQMISRQATIVGQYLPLQGSMQFVTRALTPGSTVTGANSCTCAATPGKIIAQLELVMTHYMVPGTFTSIPFFNNIIALQGTTNNQTFEGIPAGGVLYLGCNPKVVVPSLVNPYPLYNLEHRFLIQNNGPNIAADTIDQCAGVNYIYDTRYNRWDLIASPTSNFQVPLTAADVPNATRIYQQQPKINPTNAIQFTQLFGA